MTSVFVTDAHYKMSLAPIRSLSAAGFRLISCEYENVPKKQCLGFYSRYVRDTVRIPSDSDKLLCAVDGICASGDVILPVGRSSVRALAGRRSAAVNSAFLVSSLDTLKNADDKAYVFRTAKRLGIPVPFTAFLSDHSTLEALASEAVYPCIIKYRDGEALGLHSHERYSISYSRSEFLESYARMNALSPGPLVQEYLTGHDIGVALVMDENSDPVDFLCYESELEYPISGGPTCLCRTVFNRELLINACALLKELRFIGIALLDFKGSPENARLLEVNPRVWGSANICTVAGSTFFESYVKAALGKHDPIDPDTCTPTYRLGVRMRFFPQNIFALLQKLRKGPSAAFLSDLKSFFDFSVRDGLFQLADARPFFKYIKNSISNSGI